MDRLKCLSILVKVADTGNFTRCAEELNMGQPSISKAIDALEKDFGAKIFHRSTRKLSITDEGKKILLEARKVVDSYNELLTVSQLKLLPKGTVRVTCPTALGTLVVIPLLEQFKKRYPEVNVHLLITDTQLDMYDNDLDIAIRVGDLQDSTLVAKTIGKLNRIAVTSQRYLQQCPVPRSIQQLANHRCIVVNKVGKPDIWKGSTRNKKPFAIAVEGGVSVDNHLALRAAVEAGLGIGLAAKFIFLHNGKLPTNLVQILKNVTFKTFPVNIVFKDSKNVPARCRVFIDYFYEQLRKQSWIFTSEKSR